MANTLDALQKKIKSLELQLKNTKAYTLYAVAEQQKETAKYKELAARLSAKVKEK